MAALEQMTNMEEESRRDQRSSTVSQQVMHYLLVVLVASGLMATAFTAWTPASLNPYELAGQLAAAVGPDTSIGPGPLTSESGTIRIGVVAGHSGLYPDSGLPDPGAVCPDGLTERDVNMRIAELVVQYLETAGLEVDLLEEWDGRLDQYRAVALVSIHADSCISINEYATGYKVAAAADTEITDRTQRLVTCMIDRYGRATDMLYHDSLTRDMTEYHTFSEVDPLTPAIIIETGFLYLDREFLTNQPDVAARGIAEGVLCYVNNEPASRFWYEEE